MATSGSTDFSVSRDEIITEALQICGVVPEGGTASANQLSDSARTLNMMIKNWQTKPEINLWTIRKGILFLERNKVEYKMGSSGADHSCNVSDFLYTTVRTAYAAGTTLEVTSTTGMTNSDAIGVVLDDGTLEWKTLTIVDGDTLTLSGALSGPATAGNLVYSYTTKVSRPLRVLNGYVRDMTSLTDTELTIISRQEYDQYSTKFTETAQVNQLYYDPQLDQGIIKVWPEPTGMYNVIYFDFTRPIEDFDASGNTPDFPQEWYLPIAWSLAGLLALKYGVPLQERRDIIQMGQAFLMDSLAWDREGNTSIFVGMESVGD